MLIVRSPVRISFGGGGTDLPAYYERYGGAVLSTAINKYFYTILQPRTDGKIQVISSDLRVIESWNDIKKMNVKSSALEIPLSVIKESGRDLSADLFLASEIMAGTGLGSSASVCVCVLKALATYLDIPLSNYELAEKAFHIARNVLGKSVGKQDEYAAAFGGVNYISFQRDGGTLVEPLALRSDLLQQFKDSLMLFFTGASHDSWKLLQEQEHSVKQAGSATTESLHAIRTLADSMRTALEDADFELFGVLLHQGWEAKKKISSSISTPFIDEAYARARASGALGGKITGAGGGGFLLLFCEESRQEAVRHSLREMQLREMEFDLDLNGPQVIVNDPFIDGDRNCGIRWTFTPSISQPIAA